VSSKQLGANLLFNPSFANSGQGWSNGIGATFQNLGPGGAGSVQLFGTSFTYANIIQVIPVIPGATYRLSVWANNTAAGAYNSGIAVYGALGAFLSYAQVTVSGTIGYANTLANNVPPWTANGVLLIPPGYTSLSICLQLNNSATGAVSCYLSQPSVVRIA
jgi:hypothetical protein